MCSLFLPWLSVGLGLQIISLHIWVSGGVGAWEKGQLPLSSLGSYDISLFVRCRNIRNCYHIDLTSLHLLLEKKALPSAGHGSDAGERSWSSSLTAETAGVGQRGGWDGRWV